MSTTLIATINNNTKPALVCAHCSDPLPVSPILEGGQKFCCTGCATVFGMLQSSGLQDFYCVADAPVTSQKSNTITDYTFLEDAQVREQLIDFTDGTWTRARFHLPTIHCASCIWLLERLYKLNESISQCKVDFTRRSISITWKESTLSLKSLVELLAKLGYPPAIHMGLLDKAPQMPSERRLWYRLGVAGFAFGNIMLLSFPEYLGLDARNDEAWTRIFGYLNILLALPVMLYSGSDFFKLAWSGLKLRRLNMEVPIALGILVLFSRSSYEILSGMGAGYMDSLAALIFFLLVGRWFQTKTFNHLSFERDYKSYFPLAVTQLLEGKEQSVAVNKLQVGDLIRLRHQEIIPADVVLVKGDAKIDYSFVTGEADLVARKAGDRLYAGGRHHGGLIDATVVKPVSQSYLTQLWNDQTFEHDANPEERRLSDTFGTTFTINLMVVALLTAIYWFPKDAAIAVNAVTAVLIIACPCALALSVPFTFGNVVRLLARKAFFLKNTGTLEALQHVDAVVLDKTGTITQAGQAEMQYEGLPLDAFAQSALKSLTMNSAHPVSRQVHQYLNGTPTIHVDEFREITGEGIEGRVEGHWIRLGKPGFIKNESAAVHSAVDFKEGHQQTAGVLLEIDGQYLGKFQTLHQYRDGLDAVYTYLKQLGPVYILSGDNDRESQWLQQVLGKEVEMHFHQTPQNKLDFIKGLQEQGKKVMMLGDGLNDAGALKQSNAGIVIAENVNNFTPACDGIVSAQSFEYLPALIKVARNSRKLVYAAYGLALVYNVIGLSFAVQGKLEPVIAAILMPLSSFTIVTFAMLSTWLMAAFYLKPTKNREV